MRGIRASVGMIAAGALTISATPAMALGETPQLPADLGDIAEDEPPVVVHRSDTYSIDDSHEGSDEPSTQGHIYHCTVNMANLAPLPGGGWESDETQFCNASLEQRLALHNWQRHRWYGWQTLVHNEPATNWFTTQWLTNLEDFFCVPGSGTYTYRAIGRGQFWDPSHGQIATSAYVVSNEVTATC